MGLPAALTVIGEVRTGYADTEGTPIQAGLNRAERAVIEIAEPYRDGLDGLAGFGYAWLLTWLDRPHEEARRCGWSRSCCGTSSARSGCSLPGARAGSTRSGSA
jgi:tRNA (Thr-GGU) A37 N-methylase